MLVKEVNELKSGQLLKIKHYGEEKTVIFLHYFNKKVIVRHDVGIYYMGNEFFEIEPKNIISAGEYHKNTRRYREDYGRYSLGKLKMGTIVSLKNGSKLEKWVYVRSIRTKFAIAKIGSGDIEPDFKIGFASFVGTTGEMDKSFELPTIKDVKVGDIISLSKSKGFDDSIFKIISEKTTRKFDTRLLMAVNIATNGKTEISYTNNLPVKIYDIETLIDRMKG